MSVADARTSLANDSKHYREHVNEAQKALRKFGRHTTPTVLTA